jgi:4-hydroxybenzoate polyprenyltransferase
MLDFLRLIRYKNLLIIAVTQYMMRYCIINPILKVSGLELQMDQFHFILLVLSSILITAAGYVINDYFDTGTDMLNRPETVIGGKVINRKKVMLIHILLNILGFGIGIYLCFKINVIAFGAAYLFAPGILWFYSTTYKRQFLIGNLIVAIFTGMVPFVVAIFEVPLLNQQYREVLIRLNMNFNNILGWVGGFAFFAFLSTLVREIIKDIEDLKGDRAFGRNTLPVVLGIRTSKIITLCLIALNIISLLYIYFRYLLHTITGGIDYISLSYIVILLVIPFLILAYLIIKAENKNHYHQASNLTKFIMLTGILYSLVAFFIISRTF